MSDFDELDALLGYGKTSEPQNARSSLGALQQSRHDTTAKELNQILGYEQAAQGASERLTKAQQEIASGRPDPKSGLVWGPSGGWDPQSGELVIAGKPFSQPQWSAGTNLAEAASLGMGSRAAAKVAATGAPGGDPAARYAEALAQIQGAKENWTQENTGKAIATEVAGAALPTIPLLALGGGVAGGALSRLPGGETAARFLSGGVGKYGGGIGQSALRLGSDLSSGALAGASGAALQAGLHDAPLEEQVTTGAMFGAPAGAVLNPLARAIIPSEANISKATAQGAQKLIDAGVPITGKQLLGKAPGTAGQLDAYTYAAAQKFGAHEVMDQAGVRALTPEVVDAAKAKIGQKFEDFAATAGVPVDAQALSAFRAAAQKALTRPGLTVDEQKTLNDVYKYTGQVILTSMAKNGNKLDGTSFRALTATNGPLGHLFAKKDTVVGPYMQELRDFMYDTAARTAPTDAKSLQEARQQWANYKSMEPAINDAMSRSGIIDPARMVGVLKKPSASQDLKDLAQAARLLPRASEHGTPKQGSAIREILSNLPATGAGGVGGYLAAVGVTDPSSLSSIASAMAHAPTGTSALMGTLAGLGTVHGARALGNAYANSNAFTNALIRNALGQRGVPPVWLNPLVGTGVPEVYNSGGR